MASAPGGNAAALWRSTKIQIAYAAGAGILNTLAMWRTLVYVNNPRNQYFIGTPAPHDLLAALLWTTLIALGAYFLVRALARSTGKCAPWGLIALTALLSLNGLEYVRIAYFDTGRMALQVFAAVGVGVALALGCLAAVWLRWLTVNGLASACAIAMVVFSPFAATTAIQGLVRSVTLAVGPDRVPLARAGEPRSEARAAMRVVWIIFDGLDRRVIVKEDRPYIYPHFDEMRSHAVDASEAIPPSSNTLRSMPSYWLGRRVTDSAPGGPTRLNLRFGEEDPEQLFSEFDNLFSAVARDGYTAGAAGWYHPYCRLFRDSLNRCVDFYWQSVQFYETESFLDSFRVSANSLAPNWGRRVMVSIYERLRDASLDYVADPDLDFVAIHLNVPHDPPIYHPESGQLRSQGIGLTYGGNVVLADIALGLIVEQLKVSGLSEQTAVIIGSDHGSDKLPDHGSLPGAVPLIIRLPGQSEGSIMEDPVDAFHTRSLILALLRGEVSTPAEVVSLLRAMESPAG